MDLSLGRFEILKLNLSTKVRVENKHKLSITPRANQNSMSSFEDFINRFQTNLFQQSKAFSFSTHKSYQQNLFTSKHNFKTCIVCNYYIIKEPNNQVFKWKTSSSLSAIILAMAKELVAPGLGAFLQ